MKPADFNNFCEAWALAHETMAAGKVLSQNAMSSIFDDFDGFSFAMVDAALKHHRKTSKFAPTAFDIISLLSSTDKRLTPDEAWAMMPQSENETVVWTEEMAGAYAVAYDLIVESDKIAARMAFKGAYERLCNEASLMQKPVSWKVCIGYDKTLIEPALQKAVIAGRITQQIANKLIPAPQDAGVIAGFLTGNVKELPNNAQHLKEKWHEINQAMRDGQKRLDDKKRQDILDREARRVERERINQEVIEKASQLLADSA